VNGQREQDRAHRRRVAIGCEKVDRLSNT
jgi:hypothetical protein